MTAPLRDPAAGGEPTGVTFDQFRHAVMDLVFGGCCASPSLSVMRSRSVPPMRNNTPFRRLGHDAWIRTVPPRDPILPAVSGAFVLPAVVIASSGAHDTAPVDVLVSGGRIERITPAGAAKPPAGARVVEHTRGCFVASSLLDMHVHLPAANALRLTELFLLQMLRHGITVARDAGDSDGTATPAALACVASGALAGPALHYTYAFVNAPPARWSNSFAYVDPEQAPLIVKRLQWLGASWIKSYENLDLARLDALKQAAREAGMGVMGHVPARLGHEEALLPDSQHLFGVPPPKSIRRDHVLNRAIDWQAVDAHRMDVVRRASVEHDLTLTPTLHLAAGVLELERYEQACQESTAKALPSFFSAVAWHPVRGIPAYRNISRDDFDRCRAAMELKGELVQRLHQDGVRVLLGTDTQQPFSAPGIALHREFQAFDYAGIARRDSFTLATEVAAEVLAITDMGTVRAGARAELMVSRTDPRQSGWSVERDLAPTIARGVLMTAPDLDQAIRTELARFENRFGEYMSRLLAQLAMNRLAKNFVG